MHRNPKDGEGMMAKGYGLSFKNVLEVIAVMVAQLREHTKATLAVCMLLEDFHLGFTTRHFR